MKELKFKVPIYNSNVVYIETDDFIDYYKKIKVSYDNTDNDCYGLAFRGPKSYIILVKTSHKDDWSVIAHEALHVSNMILNSRGVEIDTSNDEASAYLMSYIIEKIQKYKNK